MLITAGKTGRMVPGERVTLLLAMAKSSVLASHP
tara:strand:- start:712 stop:813 length:102 start_codon:yes stop_codon:yes gene_type:complete